MIGSAVQVAGIVSPCPSFVGAGTVHPRTTPIHEHQNEHNKKATIMTQHTTGNRIEAEGNGADVSNLGDYSNIVAHTTDDKEIEVRLYGR